MKRYLLMLMMILLGSIAWAGDALNDCDDVSSDAVMAMSDTVSVTLSAMPADTVCSEVVESVELIDALPPSVGVSIRKAAVMQIDTIRHYTCPYLLPYSVTYSAPNWKRLWLNTGILCGAYVGTLCVLECLPEDATSWNRAEIRQTPPFNRWWDNIFVKGPEWDHDKFYFNYILHPYAGAVYFMGARSCGFNFYQSLLYSALISTVGWEFGIEAFMERPSYQDIFITPIVGSLIGEGFYKVKRHIVANDYELAGSKILGNAVAFIVDPINEVIGLFAGNDARQKHCISQAEIDGEIPFTSQPRHDIEPVSSFFWVTGNGAGIGVTAVF